MKNFKRLTIWTIILSSLIIIGAGHGIGCIGLLEIVGFFNKFDIGTEDFSLSLRASYDKSLPTVALFALVGHILLLISILTKSYKKLVWTKVVGLIFLWTSFYYLTHNYFSDDLSHMGFITGIPFLIGSIILAYKVVRQTYKSTYGLTDNYGS